MSLLLLEVAVQGVASTATAQGRGTEVTDTHAAPSHSRRIAQVLEAENPKGGTSAVGNGAGRQVSAASEFKRRAYVTLLYSEFIHGTRALGQSLRDSGTSADTVVLVTPDVAQEARDTLSKDGWM